jgi:hypothetical protein
LIEGVDDLAILVNGSALDKKSSRCLRVSSRTR